MISWNADGLRENIIKLEDLISDLNLDVVFIQETHLKNEPIGIPNYKLYRKDRLGNRGGGVAIAVKCCLKHEQTAVNYDRTSGTEVIGIKIITSRGPVNLSIQPSQQRVSQ
ncbi:hypothetical protein JTB14_031619 [Gonioctena quinquepunctata]|nr:hypothetical protein JTB14_031619 [Gonioctena quinquepunctata]